MADEPQSISDDLIDELVTTAVGNIRPVRVYPEWQPIETAPLETRVMLWCPERQRKDEAPCFVFGSIVKFSDGSRKVYGDGMNGDWLFTHWIPLPPPPAITAGTRSAKTT